MRSSTMILAVALVSAVPSLAAPVPRAVSGAVAGDIAEDTESAASAFIKPLVKNIASSAALTAFFGEIGKLTGSSSSSNGQQASSRREVQNASAKELIAAIESSPNFTQAKLDEVEAEFAKMMSSRELSERAVAGAATKEVLDFLAGIIGSITGKAATNEALGNNIDGTPKTSRRSFGQRSVATTLLKPLLKSAASSAAVEGFFDGVKSLFGDSSSQQPAASKRSLAADLVKPLLKSAASSAAVEGFFDGVKSLFGGSSNQAAPASRRAAPKNGDELVDAVVNSGMWTQAQLDEVESELQRTIGDSGLLRREIEARLSLKLGGLTKGLVGLIGSVAGSAGIDALFGGDDKNAPAPASRRSAPTNGDELVDKVLNSGLWTQAQLDEVESELQRTIGSSSSLLGRDLEARLALKLGGLTKGLVGLIGSIAGSAGIDALFGGDSTTTAAARRAFATPSLNELD